MRKILTKTFFKFLFGFVTILAVSFALIVAAGLANEYSDSSDASVAAPIKALK